MKRFIDHNSFLNFALDFEFLPAKFLNERVGTGVITRESSNSRHLTMNSVLN